MTSTAVAAHRTAVSQLDVSGYDGPRDVWQQKALADELSAAKALVPPLYRGSPPDVLAAMYAASALRIPLMLALKHLYWNPATGGSGMDATLMGALLLRGGVSYTVTADPGKSVTMTFTRADKLAGGTCSWTIADALRAGLTNTPHWQQYPDDMLFHRCLARGARLYGPDLVAGFGYSPNEVDEMRTITVEPAPAETPDGQVDDDVAQFLAQLTPASTPHEIRELIELASGKRIAYAGMADRHAGGGKTVAEHLGAAWADAQRRSSTDPASPTTTATAASPDGAPAGDGIYQCGCPTTEVLRNGEHRRGCDAQLTGA